MVGQKPDSKEYNRAINYWAKKVIRFGSVRTLEVLSQVFYEAVEDSDNIEEQEKWYQIGVRLDKLACEEEEENGNRRP